MNLNNLTEAERAVIITALEAHRKDLLLKAQNAHNRGVKEGYTDAVLNEVTRYTEQAGEVKKVERKAVGVGYFVK
jgi:hypothetical protein